MIRCLLQLLHMQRQFFPPVCVYFIVHSRAGCSESEEREHCRRSTIHGKSGIFNQKFLAARHLRPEDFHLNLFQQIQNTEICYHHHELTMLSILLISSTSLMRFSRNLSTIINEVYLQELYERAMAKLNAALLDFFCLSVSYWNLLTDRRNLNHGCKNIEELRQKSSRILRGNDIQSGQKHDRL